MPRSSSASRRAREPIPARCIGGRRHSTLDLSRRSFWALLDRCLVLHPIFFFYCTSFLIVLCRAGLVIYYHLFPIATIYERLWVMI